MAKGTALYNQGKYQEAKDAFSLAKKCAGGNPSEAQKRIDVCDAKMNPSSEPVSQEPYGSVGYGTGPRGIAYMPDITIPVDGQVFVEVHIDTEGTVVDARVVNDTKYPTTVTDSRILSDCIAAAKTAKYRKGKEELRIIVFK